MDQAYQDSAANLTALAGRDHRPVLTIPHLVEEEETSKGSLQHRPRLHGITSDTVPLLAQQKGCPSGVHNRRLRFLFYALSFANSRISRIL